MRDNIDSSDTFWMMHLAIEKIIKQEQHKIEQEKRKKPEPQKNKK